MSSLQSAVRIENPGAVRLTIEATLTLDEWRKVAKSLDEAKDHFVDPRYELYAAIRRAVESVDKRDVFAAATHENTNP